MRESSQLVQHFAYSGYYTSAECRHQQFKWFGLVWLYVSRFSIKDEGGIIITPLSMTLPATVPSSGGVTAVRIYEYVCNVLNLHIYHSVAEKGGNGLMVLLSAPNRFRA